MAVITRTPANTVYGVDVNVLKIGASNGLVAQFTDCTLTLENEVIDATTVIENDTTALAGIKSATLDCSNVVDGSSSLGPILEALSSAEVAVEVSHAKSGVKWAGTGIITNAEVRASGKEVLSCSCNIVSNGAWTAGAGAATDATPRLAAQAKATQRGSDIVSVAVGTDDYVNLFNEVGIRVEVQVEEGNASKDAWRVRQAVSRTTTLDLGKVVEATLPWLAMVNTGANLNCSIVLGTMDADEFLGEFLPVTGTWAASGKAAQNERITLQSVGEITYQINGGV